VGLSLLWGLIAYLRRQPTAVTDQPLTKNNR
jgi:hypothetical protein